jgi:hypothetical protein
MVHVDSHKVGEAAAVLLLLFAPMLTADWTLAAALVGTAVILFAAGSRHTPGAWVKPLAALALGVVVALVARALRG